MKWENLRKNKCPKCNKDLLTGLTIKPLSKNPIWSHVCGFKISEEKFKLIVSEMNVEEIEKFTKENNE